jgi:hypothetical protein
MMTADPQAPTAQMPPQLLMILMIMIMMIMPMIKTRPYRTTRLLCLPMMTMRMMMVLTIMMQTLTVELTLKSTMTETRTVLALRPHPSNNNTHMFLSLTTGRILHRGYQSYTVVPMPEHVIAHIDALGAAADAEPGVYTDTTNLDTDYEPLNDVSTNSPKSR